MFLSTTACPTATHAHNTPPHTHTHSGYHGTVSCTGPVLVLGHALALARAHYTLPTGLLFYVRACGSCRGDRIVEPLDLVVVPERVH